MTSFEDALYDLLWDLASNYHQKPSRRLIEVYHQAILGLIEKQDDERSNLANIQILANRKAIP